MPILIEYTGAGRELGHDVAHTYEKGSVLVAIGCEEVFCICNKSCKSSGCGGCRR